MATSTARRSKRPNRKEEPKQRPNFAERFRNWIAVKDQTAMLQDTLDGNKKALMDDIAEWGEVDEKGSQFVDLEEPISFTDRKGKTFVYRTLKRQRSLTPKDPTPDDAKTEALLKKKGMWLSEAQEKQLTQLRIALRFARITVEVSPDAVAEAYFEGLISEKEYESLLVEQKEGWSFVQLEE